MGGSALGSFDQIPLVVIQQSNTAAEEKAVLSKVNGKFTYSEAIPTAQRYLNIKSFPIIADQSMDLFVQSIPALRPMANHYIRHRKRTIKGN